MFVPFFSGHFMQNQIGARKGFSLSDPRVRAWLFQIITVAVVGAGLVPLPQHPDQPAAPGHHLGFRLLERSAGFGIAQHLIPYTESDSYAGCS
jgi:general L-amino acid transport system permease protein